MRGRSARHPALDHREPTPVGVLSAGLDAVDLQQNRLLVGRRYLWDPRPIHIISIQTGYPDTFASDEAWKLQPSQQPCLLYTSDAADE